jgi:hypothetical protein
MNLIKVITVFIATLLTFGCSDSATKKSTISMFGLDIPKDYLEREVDLKSDYVILSAEYPSMRPYGPKYTSIREGEVRVIIEKIRYRSKTDGFLSDYKRLKGSGIQAEIIFVGEREGFDVFNVLNISKKNKIDKEVWRLKKLPNGDFLSFYDSGSWSTTIIGNRRIINEGIQVTYQFRKSLSIDPMQMDKLVNDLIVRFLKPMEIKL